MTTLYKKKGPGSNWTYIGMEEATLSDLKAALEAHGMIAVTRDSVSALLDDLEGPCDAEDCPQCQMYGELRNAIGGEDGKDTD